MLPTIVVLLNIPKHGFNVSVARVSMSWKVCTVL